MIICGLDLETTGLLADDHRIVEVYAGLWRENGTLAFEYEQRINPQRAIAVEAQRVHGITSTDLLGKPLWPAVAPVLLKVMSKAQLFVAHNGDEFDWKFLEMEFKRISLPMPPIITVSPGSAAASSIAASSIAGCGLDGWRSAVWSVVK